jgi:hypothetical protein
MSSADARRKVALQSAIMNKGQVTSGPHAIPPPIHLNETHATESWRNKQLNSKQKTEK